MQCPFSQFYELEFSEDSCSEEDYRSYRLNYPCCKCLERENLDLYIQSLEKEKQVDCSCCKCIEKNKEKPKVKGKFGLAYVVQTPKDESVKPLGWQVEFQDTPSQIDRKCEKMLKWVTCPPLGECSNLQANFLWCPVECKELLDTSETKKNGYEQEPFEKCCLIEIPKVKAIETNQTACICQANEEKSSFSRNKNLKQKCSCVPKNKTCHECMNPKNNCTCLQKQFEKFMLCKNCCKALTKCTCTQTSGNAFYERKQKCKCRPSPKSPRRGSERDVLDVCKHCQKSKSYYCTIEEQICPSCGKVMEKNCYVKENCVCEQYDDSLDYIPRRDVCPKRKCRQMKDGSSQIKAREPSYVKRDSAMNKRPKSVENTRPENKTSHIEEKPPQIENKPPSTGSNVPRPESPKRNQFDVSKDELKADSEQEVAVEDLIVFDDVEDVKPLEPKKEKKFTTRANGDEPSLLERIKQAHHKQMHEIHPEIPL